MCLYVIAVEISYSVSEFHCVDSVSEFISSSVLPLFLSLLIHFVVLGREETLTQHAMGWNKRKISGLAESLAKKSIKVTMVNTQSCTYHHQ